MLINRKTLKMYAWIVLVPAVAGLIVSFLADYSDAYYEVDRFLSGLNRVLVLILVVLSVWVLKKEKK